MKRIEVAVGVLFDQAERVLVGQRVVRDDYFAKWEFPGGKLELGESPEHALQREFLEELGVRVSSSEPLIELNHDYPDRHVRLHVRIIQSYSGIIKPMEGQALQWVYLQDLDSLDFLAGNTPIVDELIARSSNSLA